MPAGIGDATKPPWRQDFTVWSFGSVAAPQRRLPKPISCYLRAFLNRLKGSGNCSAAALFYNSIQSSWALKNSLCGKNF